MPKTIDTIRHCEESIQQSPATPSLHLGVKGDCGRLCMLSTQCLLLSTVLAHCVCLSLHPSYFKLNFVSLSFQESLIIITNTFNITTTQAGKHYVVFSLKMLRSKVYIPGSVRPFTASHLDGGAYSCLKTFNDGLALPRTRSNVTSLAFLPQLYCSGYPSRILSHGV